MRPLNFLHLTTFYPPYSFGGDGSYLYRLCHALGDAGHRVDVLHCLDSFRLLHTSEPELEVAEHPRVSRIALSSSFGVLSPLASYLTGQPYLKADQIQKAIRQKSYDVIHFHNMSLFGPGVLNLKPTLDRFVKIYTTHDHWLVCPTHVLWKFNSRPCEKPQCWTCAVRTGRPPQLWRSTNLLEKSSREIDQFIAPSRFAAEMHGSRGFKQSMTILPGFAHDAGEVLQTSKEEAQIRPFFLFVGRLETVKGLHTLIALWNRVQDSDLLVVGTGGQETQLRAQASRNPRIRFLGQLPSDQLEPLYAQARACIVPSMTYETFGLVVIEAFACKTPAIVRNIGALPELVQESAGGITYEDDQGLLQAIQLLSDSDELRRKLGNSGYQTFLRLWSRQAHLSAYFELLDQVAQRKFGQVPWGKLTS